MIVFRALCEEPLNSAIIRTDTVGGQLVGRHVVGFEAIVLCKRAILPLTACLVSNGRIHHPAENSKNVRSPLLRIGT
jgi:hypothetical protein